MEHSLVCPSESGPQTIAKVYSPGLPKEANELHILSREYPKGIKQDQAHSGMTRLWHFSQKALLAPTTGSGKKNETSKSKGTSRNIVPVYPYLRSKAIK